MENLKSRILALVNSIANLESKYAHWITNEVMGCRISEASTDEAIYDKIYYYYDGDCDGDQWEDACFGKFSDNY